MEANSPENNAATEPESVPTPRKKEELKEVIARRNWKEYLGESLLIIFSVSLAIFLTEIFTQIHENRQTREVLHQLRIELTINYEAEESQYQYHLQVMHNIDSALQNENFRKKFISKGRIHLSVIAPEGVLKNDLNDIAWQVAKQNNIFSKIDLKTYALLTDIYDNQQRITNSEAEIGKLLLSFESRKPENAKTTLILLSDNYFAWAVERAPKLLIKYKKAIDALRSY